MDNCSFTKAKEIAIQWIEDNERNFKSKNTTIDFVENNKERLYVTLDFGECIAAIVVTEPDFAPYRFVSLEVAAMENGIPVLLYSWYDKEDNTIEEIIKNLDKAIDIALEYINSQGAASV